MKYKRLKLLFIIAMVTTCFLGFLKSASNQNDVVEVSAQQDYSNYNFYKGNTFPSELKCADGNSNDTSPSFDDEGRLNISNGGSSDITSTEKRPYGKRTVRFTLYESVKMEISLYITGSSRSLLIGDGTNQLASFTVSTKNTSVYFQYTFTDVPPSGKTFLLGGSGSALYADYIEFGVSDRARFDANGGTFSDGSKIKIIERTDDSSDAVSAPETPTNGDKIFVGWSETATGSVVDSFEYNKTYYAIWRDASGINIVLDYFAKDIEPGETFQLTPTVLPTPTIAPSDSDFTWESSNTAIATVENGLVTGISEGVVTITCKYKGTKTATCEVEVREYITYMVYFYDNYDNYVADTSENHKDAYSTVEVGADETVYNVPVFGSGKGYDVTWKVDVNKTPSDKSDDVTFDSGEYVTEDMFIYAEVQIFPVATLMTLSIPEENNNAIEISDRECYLPVGETVSLNYVLSRENEEEFDAVVKTSAYQNTCNDIKWYTSDESVAKVDNNGKVTMLNTGKAEIYATLYEGTAATNSRYQKHIVIASSIQFSCIGNRKDASGNSVDFSVGIKGEIGRFIAAGGSEKAVRFIGYISESFFPYISKASFKVEAIDSNGILRATFNYDVTYFSKEISYQSKSVYSSAYFKTWSKEGYLGAAFTITGLPTNSFVGTFKATFMVQDQESEIIVPNKLSVAYRGV